VWCRWRSGIFCFEAHPFQSFLRAADGAKALPEGKGKDSLKAGEMRFAFVVLK
jgi:hypothetical protein